MVHSYLALLFIFFSALLEAKTDFGPEWEVSRPHPTRTFFSHKTSGTFVLLTQYQVSFAEEKFEEFFASEFPSSARSMRRDLIQEEGEEAGYLSTGSNTYQGIRYGSTSFSVIINQKDFQFHERLWVEGKTLWHLTMVEQNSKISTPKILDEIMIEIIAEKKITFLSAVSGVAYAADTDRCELPDSKKLAELNQIIPKIRNKVNEQKCRKLSIHSSNLAGSYGVKLHNASGSSCLNGAGSALRKMKDGFLSNLNSWAGETDKRARSLGCHEPKMGEGFLASLAYSHLMDAYSKCMSAASMGAGASLIAQSLGQTAKSLRALYRWVKAEENPIGVITSILAAKYEGFMCLTASAQMRAVCEFSTHFLAALGASATGAGSVAAILKGVSAVRKLASVAPAKKKVVLTRSPGEARALSDVKKNSQGLSVTFASHHPFVRSVAQGRAQAFRVARELRDGAILSRSPKEMDAILKRKGFTRIDTCIKLEGKCVRHKNPRTGKLEIAPMIVYVHPSGLATRLKPHGQSNAKFRREPHGSFMLVNPSDQNLSRALTRLRTKEDKERFMNQYLSWDKELAKMDMNSLTPLPSAPSRTRNPKGLNQEELRQYHDTLTDLTHFPLK